MTTTPENQTTWRALSRSAAGASTTSSTLLRSGTMLRSLPFGTQRKFTPFAEVR
jgi:hypothetical protein